MSETRQWILEEKVLGQERKYTTIRGKHGVCQKQLDNQNKIYSSTMYFKISNIGMFFNT